MKLLIISDVHSNPEGLKAIWEKENGADAVYFAGDAVDYGTDPVGAIDWLRGHNAHAVYGNHDEKIMRMFREDTWRTLPATGLTWGHHNCERIDEDRLNYLKSLPSHMSFTADGIAYLMTHRIANSYEIIESKSQFDHYWAEHFTLPGCEGLERRMIFGHTHRQMAVNFDGNAMWFNPGSASYRRPDEASKDAFYATVTDGVIEFKHVSYDRTPLQKEVHRLRSKLSVDEYRVADFFFCWDEADGPDTPWIDLLKSNTR